MKNKKMIVVLLIILSVFNSMSVYANTTQVNTNFSTVPDEEDKKLMHTNEEDVTAWIVDNNGNKTYVNPKEFRNNNARSFTQGKVLWTFVRYEPKTYESKDYKHFVSHVSVKNGSKKQYH